MQDSLVERVCMNAWKGRAGQAGLCEVIVSSLTGSLRKKHDAKEQVWLKTLIPKPSVWRWYYRQRQGHLGCTCNSGKSMD